MDVANFVVSLLSAIATLGATVLALWLAGHDKVQKIDAVFLWDYSTENHPLLYLKNIGHKAVVLKNIIVRYKGVQICCISLDDSMREYKLIKAQEEKTIPLHKKIDNFNKPKNENKEYALEVLVYTTRGRKFVSKQKYTYEELQYLLFSESFN